MRIFVSRMLIKQSMQEKESCPKDNDDTIEASKEEHNRLGALKDESETIWEERTYQLSAGGLSITFAVFSFLMSRGIGFQWPMALIWGGFVFCLIVNYLSQRISTKHFEKQQVLLYEDRLKKIPYDEKKQIERYKRFDRCMVFCNVLTEIILVLDIVLTIVYACILLTN